MCVITYAVNDSYASVMGADGSSSKYLLLSFLTRQYFRLLLRVLPLNLLA